MKQGTKREREACEIARLTQRCANLSGRTPTRRPLACRTAAAPGTLSNVAEIPRELRLPTFSARLLGERLVVFVCTPGLDIDDDDWKQYVDWLRTLQKTCPEIRIFTAAGGRAPSAEQRGLLNRELDVDRVRVAILLSNPALLPIVKVTAWFMRGVKPFGADEVAKALAYLEETDVVGVRSAVQELGGVLHRGNG